LVSVGAGSNVSRSAIANSVLTVRVRIRALNVEAFVVALVAVYSSVSFLANAESNI
jgi:hypothetical protein